MPLNLLGIIIYLRLASELWPSTSELGSPGGTGDAFWWAFCLLPFLAFFVVANVIALALLVWKLRSRERVVAIGVWALIATLWVLANAYDNYRATRYVDANFVSASDRASRGRKMPCARRSRALCSALHSDGGVAEWSKAGLC
ncbi:MAG: hypothetical protein KF715_02280 [Candidatus Didemnitutus sp.]|nr:hypothetical protein [Candidatus Didemnitutus sp.]